MGGSIYIHKMHRKQQACKADEMKRSRGKETREINKVKRANKTEMQQV